MDMEDWGRQNIEKIKKQEKEAEEDKLYEELD